MNKLSIGVKQITNKEKDGQAKKMGNRTNKLTDRLTGKERKSAICLKIFFESTKTTFKVK